MSHGEESVTYRAAFLHEFVVGVFFLGGCGVFFGLVSGMSLRDGVVVYGGVFAHHADVAGFEAADAVMSADRQADGQGQGRAERELSEVDVHIVVYLNLWKENGNIGISLVRISNNQTKKVEIVITWSDDAIIIFHFRFTKVSIKSEKTDMRKDFLRIGIAIRNDGKGL